ncbi:ion channel [Natroniella sulfidigena]|uniref:potassium channel family protein n=1 Tax=Natroniella sulfidigena TaxID=723921 RepID=UPI00200AF072|nr:potassium channel family protein [Natroniella sulfidigena]MCK8818060.1 ion channel [Natroniella sulfidigena]
MENKPRAEEGLNYSDRYILALKSYLELILNYGLIFYALNTNFAQNLFAAGESLFKPKFSSVFEAVYFSANTITVVGYGDIFPIHFLSQLFSIFQILTGLFLLIITLTIYVTLNFTNQQDLKPQQKNNQPLRKTAPTALHILTIILIIVVGVLKISKWLR